MRTLFLLAVLISADPAAADGIEIPCADSPPSAVLQVPKPADRFLHVLCSKYGHLLAPTVGWFWTQPGTYNPLFFPAQMVRENPKDSGHSFNFSSITATALTGTLAHDKWAVLAGIFPKEQAPDKALEIIAINNSGETHTIYIFPNTWGYSCSPKCRKENAFIMISEKKEHPEW
jgi:hypothetical protein